MSWLDDLINAFAPIEKTPAHVSTDGTVEGDVSAEETFITKVDESLMEPMTLANTQEKETETIGHLTGVGKGRDITRHEFHEPEQRLGTPADLVGEFHAGRRSVESGGESLYPEDAHPDALKHLEERLFPLERHENEEHASQGSRKNPTYTVDAPANAFTTQRITVGANAEIIAENNPNRLAITIKNPSTSGQTLYFSSNPGGATAINGFDLAPGESITIGIAQRIWAIATGVMNVAIIEYIRQI